MENPLVSVIIPVRDGARFLAPAIESALGQSYRPLEVLVVDDGSTDGSGDIARGYRDIRYIGRGPSGLAATRNAGVEAARGGLISFLDADDLWEERKTSLQVDILREEPHTDYVVAYLRNFVEPGIPCPTWVKPEMLEQDQLAYSTGTLLARRRVFERIGAFDTRFTVGDDTDWFTRVQAAGLGVQVLHEVLLHRRLHDRNHTTETLHLCRAETLRLLRDKLARSRGAPA